MEYQLERKVILSNESEHASLYRWSISEEPLERGGVRDQIPWAWTLWFEGMDVTLSDIVESDRYLRKDEETYAPVRHRRAINAKLRATEEGLRSWDVTRFSFFGTDRYISDIRLSVEELPADDENERCEVWGCPSYQFEGSDFRTQVRDDYLGFNLFVRRETFARLATQISLSAVNSLSFRAGAVPGFYSGWSPTIETSRIKILSSLEDHRVEIPPGCVIDPPRLDRAGDFHISLNSAHVLKEEPEAEDGTTDEPVSRPVPTAVAVPSQSISQHHLLAALNQLQIAAWVIVALLVFNLVRGFLR